MKRNLEKFLPKIEREKSKDKEKDLAQRCVKEFQTSSRSELNKLKEKIETLKRKEGPREEIEALTIKIEGEKIYQNYFVERLDRILKHKFEVELKEGQKEKIVFREIIEGLLERFWSSGFLNLPSAEKGEFQKKFSQQLVETINKIPPGSWSIDFEKAIKTGKMNCQCCSTLLGLILESTRKITEIEDIEYGFPIDHAVILIRLADKRILLLDSRKGIVEEIMPKENTEIEKYKDLLKIYKIKKAKRKRVYQIIPVLPLKEGILVSYCGNLAGAYFCFKEKFPEALKEYITEEDREFLEKLKKKLKELEKLLQEEGKGDLFQEEKLSEQRIQHIGEILRMFNRGLGDYRKSEEFQKEINRCRKIYYRKERD